MHFVLARAAREKTKEQRDLPLPGIKSGEKWVSAHSSKPLPPTPVVFSLLPISVSLTMLEKMEGIAQSTDWRNAS